MQARALIVAVGLALLLGACGGGPSKSGESPSPVVETKESSIPSETPTTPAQMTLGQTLELEQGITIDVTDYRKDARTKEGDVEPGQRMDVALVKACNGTFNDDPDGAGVGTILRYGNFTLVDADGGEYQELDLTPSPAPQPQLNANGVLGKGACKKGWVPFALPKQTKVGTLSYNSNGESLGSWQVSKR